MSKLKKALISVSVAAVVAFAMNGTASAAVEKTGTITGEVVNFRKEPDLSAKILLQLTKGTEVSVTDNEGDWYKAEYNDTTGWIHADYIEVKDKSIGTGVVTGSVVNVRSEPSTESEVLAKFEKGVKLEIYERSGKWYRIKLEDGSYGWMHSDYLVIRQETASRGSVKRQSTSDQADKAEAASAENAETESAESSAAKDSNSELRQKIVEYAKTLIGIKYKYGGSTPKGFDCSGFVKYVYNHFGIDIARTSAEQSTGGKAVKKADLQPGDLVFFDTIEDGKLNDISHVGIYIGDGKFIHASTYQKKAITIESLSSAYYSKRYMKARDYISK